MPMGEEECRRYIIVFKQPCPCETGHAEPTQQEALATELKSLYGKHNGDFDAMAGEMLSVFRFDQVDGAETGETKAETNADSPGS